MWHPQDPSHHQGQRPQASCSHPGNCIIRNRASDIRGDGAAGCPPVAGAPAGLASRPAAHLGLPHSLHPTCGLSTSGNADMGGLSLQTAGLTAEGGVSLALPTCPCCHHCHQRTAPWHNLHLGQPWLPQSPDGTRRSSFWQLNRKALEAGQGPREKEGRQAAPVSLLCRGDRACSPHAPCLGLQGWGRVPFFP